MLKLVTGTSGSGKTEYVFKEIKKLVENGVKDILLITPEQFSFIAERRLLTDLGEQNVRFVDNSSFSRISDTVRREYGCGKLKVLSKGSKAVFMMRAVEASKDSLQLFNKRLDSLYFVNSMLSIYDEMKSCNLTSGEIYERSLSINNEALKKKLADISLIMNTYELMLKDRYSDNASELTVLYNRLTDIEFFKGKYVFLDGFNGFVAQEYKILELIVKESSCTTITLCTDSPESTDNYNLFGYVNNSAEILTKISKKAGVEVKNKYLTENFRAKNNEILHLEKYVLRENYVPCSTSENVEIYCAKDITDESRQLARNVRKLLRNGYKAEEIAVITRDIDKYRDEISVTLKKYGIPFYNDERQPIKNQPLVVFIEYLLRCVNFSLRSDDILSLAKTGLTGIAREDINELENYVYLWNINGKKWTKPFENSTKGFVGKMTESDKKSLDKINNVREKLIEPILSFKNSVKGADCKEICAQIYYALINFRVDESVKQLAVNLSRLNKNALAEEQGRVWDLVMNILGELPESLGDDKVSLKEFAKIFSLVISTEDLGVIPSGIDNVQFGQADRIRTDNPRAVFILGANEGEFPKNITTSGLLSESDRKIMLENDFKLYSYSDILNLQERYFAYMACTCASEKVFVSYSPGSTNQNASSEIVESIKNIFNVKEKTISDVSDIDLIESRENAFELMSERYMYNTEFYSSLKEYFKDDSAFEAISSLAENKSARIKSKETSTSLFGSDMYVSASRVEDFYNCPFRYFCKFGLNARPRNKAEIDPMQRGTLIHYVLEKVLSDVGSKALSKLGERQIVDIVDKYANEFFMSEMGNINDLSLRFKYNYKRLSKLIYSVVIHLAKEFSVSDFEAKAFELSIDKDGQVKPEVLSLDDGGTIQIRGSIDRVDTFEKNNERYVRVVDYKSGRKVFNLSDIMQGLNLQMFIYLFSLCEDKTASLNGTPAGVLYMHSSRDIFPFDSKKSAESDIEQKEDSSYKMKGIVLRDDGNIVANAMEKDFAGKYIPVKMNKNEELTGSLASLEEFGLIHKKVNSLVAQMGSELHSGNISHSPVKNKNHKNTCDFCDYKDVCANKKIIECRVTEELTDEEVKKQLVEEFSKNA